MEFLIHFHHSRLNCYRRYHPQCHLTFFLHLRVLLKPYQLSQGSLCSLHKPRNLTPLYFRSKQQLWVVLGKGGEKRGSRQVCRKPAWGGCLEAFSLLSPNPRRYLHLEPSFLPPHIPQLSQLYTGYLNAIGHLWAQLPLLPQYSHKSLSASPCKFPCILFFVVFLKFIFNLTYLERGEGRQKEREKNIDVWEIHRLDRLPSHPAHNPGMCLDWELNQPPFGLQAGTQSKALFCSLKQLKSM